MRVRARGWLIALAVALAACGGGAGTGGGRDPSSGPRVGGVLILIVPPPPELPFDPRSARLAQATHELTEIAGHPVSFELEAALLPEWRSSFELELIAAIENTARDLASIKNESPRIFERAVPKIEKIACRYQATAKGADAVLDMDARTITVTEPPGVSSLVARGLVRGAVIDEFEAFLDRTYRSKRPDDIPPGERAAYFEYLTRTRPGFGNLIEGRAKIPPGDEGRRARLEAHAEIVLRVAQLGKILGKSADPLAKAVRAWLADEAERFDHAYQTDAEAIAGLPATSAFRSAEAEYVRWLSADLSALTDKEQWKIARVLFPSRPTCRDGEPCPDLPRGFPGFDRFAFGLGLVDAWRSEGRPRDGEGAHFELIDEVVCPHFVRADGKRDRNRGCGEGFYQQAAATDATRKRLVDAMVQRHDLQLVDEVFANLDRVPIDRVVLLWRALEPNAPEWTAASRVIVEHLMREHGNESAFVQEAGKVWQRAPDKRGVALYVILTPKRGYDRHYADPDMAAFAKRFGEPVSAAALAQLADQGPRAVTLVPIVWPALGKGYARGEVLAPRLERFLAEGRALGEGEPNKTMRAIVGRICDDKDLADLARVHATIDRYARAHPDQAASLATLLVDTTRCRPPRAPEGGLD